MAGLFRASSGSLAAALDLAAHPVSGRQTRRIPALSAVRLTAEGDGLSITSTAVDDTVTTRLDGTAEGEVAVPLDMLAALMRHFPAAEEVVIAADHRAAAIAAGNSSFRLPVFPITDLPEPLVLGPETGCVELDAGVARDLFARPAFAAADDASCPYLNGILLHNVDDQLVAVATDGFRFCRVTTPAASTLSADHSLIIPNEMERAINRLLGSTSGRVMLRRSANLFAADGSGFVVVSRTIGSTYPDHERWIPIKATNVVTTNCVGVREALARFKAVADPQIRPHEVSLRWNAAGLQLRADGGEDRLAAGVEGEGETAAQIHYLDVAIGAVRGANVRISVADSGGMILVTDPDDEGFVAGLMPIRPRSS
ncbi:DNA polymerase III subunit beta [Bradyrhizobium liaoningense]|uniref:DNA polymerase III subunit beta n=1 Tax=Bradyrhizobium liaoningense TaxID=43992 RepID=UPI001BAD92C1|nr:DNA polymerase III subunit beta [Bradyrhizobium liaoningense]MBR0719393.1 hypothetical protein [Bradyrhizobium liaoningense]